MKQKTISTLAIVLLMAISLSACSGIQTSLLNRAEDSADATGQLTESLSLPVSNKQSGSTPQLAQSNSSLAQAGLLEDYQDTLVAIYEKVNPAVVNIRVMMQAEAINLGGLPTNPFESIPGFPEIPTDPGDDSQQGVPLQQALGSGFVWDQDGHIVTNNHVVEDAEKIEVTFSDGTIVPAELVGTDSYSDLAVVKVDLPDNQITPIETADTDQVKVGQVAIAIGNPFGLNGTMTLGIISALGRTISASESMITTGASYSIPNIIQTDAPINPGNSGGVLVNLNSELIGVPTAIESTTGTNAGIGFAIPASIVDKVVPELINDGNYEHPYLGIQGTSLTPDIAKAMDLDADTLGALIIEVTPGSPAGNAGLLGSTDQTTIDGQSVDVGGDVIIAADNSPIKGMDDLIEFLNAETEVGQQVTLTVLRDDKQVDVNVTLGARPGQTTTARQVTTPEETSPKGTYLGIAAIDMTPEIAQAMNLDQNQSGILVQQVQDGSPAYEAGLRAGSERATINNQRIYLGGDVITAIDGQAINSLKELQAYLQQQNPGLEVVISILRDGNPMKLTATLGERSTQ